MHVVELPVSTFVVQALPSLQVVGHELCGSHVSVPSTAPLPHAALQSESVFCVHPAGQQPSPPLHTLIGNVAHAALQFAVLPVSTSVEHAFPSLHVVTQDDCGSQVSF